MSRPIHPLLVSALLLPMLLLLAACGESTTPIGYEPPGDGEVPRVGGVYLRALARHGSVRLRWLQESPSNPELYYRLTWRPAVAGAIAATDTGTQFVYWFVDPDDFPGGSKTFTAEIFELGSKLYEFQIDVMKRGRSDIIATKTMKAAPGLRIYEDARRAGQPLRLYEEGSELGGSGLVIDAVAGTAHAVTRSEARPRSVQLALVEGNHELVLQIASTTEWGESGAADADVRTWADGADGYDELYVWAPLDEWWSTPPGPFDATGWTASGRYHWIEGGGRGLFLLGDPASPERCLVRITTVKGEGPRHLRGVAPDRYVELEISLGHPGVPFA